jgi:hypothetical protein
VRDALHLLGEAVPLGDDLIHGGQRGAGVAHGDFAARLRQRGEVIREPRDLDGLDEPRVREQVPEACPGEPPRLGERPDDRQAIVASEDRRRRFAAELPVRLIDDHEARPGVQSGANGIERLRVSRRVVRRAHERDRRLGDSDGGGDVSRVQVPRLGYPSLLDQRRRHLRDVGVHRVGRLKEQSPPAGAAERQQKRLDDLVGAVGDPDPVARPRETCAEALPQGERLAVGIPVERRARDPLGEILHEPLGRRPRRLVRIETDRRVDLWGAVGRQAFQVVANLERARHESLTSTARACAVSPSAVAIARSACATCSTPVRSKCTTA